MTDQQANPEITVTMENGEEVSFTWKERYDIECPSCQMKLDCAPSLFHRQGMFNLGGGSCPHCKKMMNIAFDPYTNSMRTSKHEISADTEIDLTYTPKHQ